MVFEILIKLFAKICYYEDRTRWVIDNWINNKLDDANDVFVEQIKKESIK